jgi:hypothetical protein
MRIIAVQTGTVALKKSQQQGSRGDGAIRLVNTMLDNDAFSPRVPCEAGYLMLPII